MSEHTEEWRPVVGYEGQYEVSDWGRFRSIDRVVRNGNGTWTRRGYLRNLTPSAAGYLYVHVCRDGVSSTLAIHVAVLTAFVGPRPPEMVTRHLNNNPADNRVENLAWGTQRENIHDQMHHGTHAMSGRTHCANGHEFTEENTMIVRTRNGRICRECRRQVRRNYKRPSRAKKAVA